ncbi:MAG: hypothetical protein F4X99_08530 [Gammaproteobacteria bacterium]|nr:hypothetical protein [Gammaproteobacteria bacterium]
MSALPYDTLKAVEHFSKAGFDKRQAKALVEHNAGLVGDTLVTKNDLDLAIKGLKKDLTILLGGIMVAGISVIGVLVNL